MRGWRPLLRLAWRDVRRARARSALVLVLIALPVLAVTTALVVAATGQVTGTEALERRLGTADALVEFDGYSSRVFQTPDPDTGMGASEGDGRDARFTLGTLEQVLDRDVRAVEWRRTELRVETDRGVARAGASYLDLADPLTEGLARLEEGRLPAEAGEVLVNRALAARGPGLGETLTLVDGTTYEVVGVGEHAVTKQSPTFFTPEAPPSATGTPVSWLVAAGDVTWEEVRALNEHGARVLSRAVLRDPPPDSAVAPEVRGGSGDEEMTVVLLVVVMVLLEVVLLAGPAFAVTARRQSRTLALMAAVGGTPAQARGAILAVALVLGSLAAAAGALGGIALARGIAPVVQHYSGSWLGPFDVPWLLVAVVAGCGLLAALLAAAAPAWLASRTDVVAVLAGRRGDAAPSTRSPLLGVVLLGTGVAGAVVGARKDSGGEAFIAGSAIVSVLGMVLIVPVVLGLLSRVGGRLPLPLRYAVRDAVRHRTRTVPAVAAVAATVCGVVALGISTSSDARQNEATYAPQLPYGDGIVTAVESTPAQWQQLEQVVRRELPEATVTPVVGVPELMEGYVEVGYRLPGERGSDWFLEWTGGNLGTSGLVADELPAVLRDLSDAERERGDRALAEGRVVVFTDDPVDADQVRVKGSVWDDQAMEQTTIFGPETLPATFVQVESRGYPVPAVVPTEVAEQLGMEVSTVALHVTGAPIPDQTAADLDEAAAATGEYAGFYVERGYVPHPVDRWVVWVLAALGGVLMVGGTLTVTFLALSDARPDLATLAAVGAAPRTRRAVAASYALVVGFVGAALGALVGLVPGIAVAFPLTRSYGDTGTVSVGPFVEVPWLMIGAVVLLLPLLTAALVALCTRSRLPMVARLD